VHDINQEQEQQAQVHALPSSVIQVGIADDHPIVRRALRWCIDQNTDMHVAGEASTGREAIELVRTVAIDVLLLDVDMPGRSGMDALATIKSSSRRRTLGVLMLSSYPEDVYAVPLIRAGASGYVGKSCPPEEIGAAIRAHRKRSALDHPCRGGTAGRRGGATCRAERA
jgi:two-component system, NarL family, invasion response regulator UvrY